MSFKFLMKKLNIKRIQLLSVVLSLSFFASTESSQYLQSMSIKETKHTVSNVPQLLDSFSLERQLDIIAHEDLGSYTHGSSQESFSLKEAFYLAIEKNEDIKIKPETSLYEVDSNQAEILFHYPEISKDIKDKITTYLNYKEQNQIIYNAQGQIIYNPDDQTNVANSFLGDSGLDENELLVLESKVFILSFLTKSKLIAAKVKLDLPPFLLTMQEGLQGLVDCNKNLANLANLEEAANHEEAEGRRLKRLKLIDDWKEYRNKLKSLEYDMIGVSNIMNKNHVDKFSNVFIDVCNCFCVDLRNKVIEYQNTQHLNSNVDLANKIKLKMKLSEPKTFMNKSTIDSCLKKSALKDRIKVISHALQDHISSLFPYSESQKVKNLKIANIISDHQSVENIDLYIKKNKKLTFDRKTMETLTLLGFESKGQPLTTLRNIEGVSYATGSYGVSSFSEASSSFIKSCTLEDGKNFLSDIKNKFIDFLQSKDANPEMKELIERLSIELEGLVENLTEDNFNEIFESMIKILTLEEHEDIQELFTNISVFEFLKDLDAEVFSQVSLKATSVEGKEIDFHFKTDKLFVTESQLSSLKEDKVIQRSCINNINPISKPMPVSSKILTAKSKGSIMFSRLNALRAFSYENTTADLECVINNSDIDFSSMQSTAKSTE